MSEAVARLAKDSGVQEPVARQALEQFLTESQELKSPEGRALFAFKLHQFISGPGKLLCTLASQGKRQITLDAQRFPHPLLPGMRPGISPGLDDFRGRPALYPARNR